MSSFLQIQSFPILCYSFLDCFSNDIFPRSNVGSGQYRFRDISDPKECQRKCQDNSQCDVFVLHERGRWKGCWLKTNNNGNPIMSSQKATVGPKYCPIVSICAKDEFDCRLEQYFFLKWNSIKKKRNRNSKCIY